ncbi:hypothetical protein [Actinoalloteichus sp. GBA129-24]|uniref:hypothetical protein n=1 Tax=Actinoalloteichus sp. GBA129-24 TaxID=1612551 RepID=UPI0009506C79|nr:hypothetical protein [Actinoalloteichus sp. GBA129-24]APU20915.1 hypothetical protein UA75_14525 [Actinoalloteichus sp. GBA129-24]APU24164.1 hypothetical protein UA75_31005 [Actinoalloteichus sp. GBA129-24]
MPSVAPDPDAGAAVDTENREDLMINDHVTECPACHGDYLIETHCEDRDCLGLHCGICRWGCDQ